MGANNRALVPACSGVDPCRSVRASADLVTGSRHRRHLAAAFGAIDSGRTVGGGGGRGRAPVRKAVRSGGGSS